MLDLSTARGAEVRAGTEVIWTAHVEAEVLYKQPTPTTNCHILEEIHQKNIHKRSVVQEIVEKETADMVATRKKEQETTAKEQ